VKRNHEVGRGHVAQVVVVGPREQRNVVLGHRQEDVLVHEARQLMLRPILM